MLERRDAITNEVLEAITFVLAYSTVLYFNINLDFCLVSGYTGCNRRNGPNFGRVFLMLNYTEKAQNTYIQS